MARILVLFLSYRYYHITLLFVTMYLLRYFFFFFPKTLRPKNNENPHVRHVFYFPRSGQNAINRQLVRADNIHIYIYHFTAIHHKSLLGLILVFDTGDDNGHVLEMLNIKSYNIILSGPVAA